MLQTLHRLHRPPHLTLALQEEQDAPALFSLIQLEKARLRHTLAWPDSVRHIEDTLTTIKENREDFFAGRAAVYLIRWQGEIAGVASFNSLKDSQGEIGYWMAERFQGQGIASQAIALLIDSFANAAILDTFIIKAATVNQRSNALAQRLGFEFVECLPAAEKIGDNVYDQNRYRLQRAAAR
ncbi:MULTISPECIES: GNAT family N-acetyltransferase [unclassified Symbiopectobacterium]|uniref:GNAT family N-acetyltransferase n=1 Tax=unclassified Symbiopectobacterium TaxID=2794573 RepID=UPI0022269F40|nr:MULTISPECIES: GNAT family N-acetyltransferase [unclassified Symbiopectobacterium]MCW2475916.1 GNAT family N-acetyltransferase [Candidatus Symbiopectobacterium sp. NZEC151]MCW2485856.1 GNAT family N-acetyltransferase [Candidatus Symbiopectobacterium sp. NZEC127]